MKKTKLIAAALIGTALLFAGCSNGNDDDPEIVQQDPSDQETEGADSGDNQNPSDNSNNGNKDDDSKEKKYDASNLEYLSSYYKEYFVGAENGKGTFEDWGSGTTTVTNDDYSATLTNGTGWGNVSCLSYGSIPAGYFSRFESLVVTLDLNGYSVSERENGNDGVNVQLASATPNAQTAIEEYGTEIAKNVFTYVIPLSGDKSPWTDVSKTTQIAFIIGGTGTLTIKEAYVASETKPAADASALAAKIESATAVIEENAENIGNNPGNFTQDSVDALMNAIETAVAVLNNADVTQEEIDAAAESLSKAISDFNDSKVVPFTAISETVIPEGATVIFSAKAANENATSVVEYNQVWWDGFSTSDYVIDESTTVKKISFGTQTGACGAWAWNTGVSINPSTGKKVQLVLSVLSESDFKVKPVAPDAEYSQSGSSSWQTVKIDYTSQASLTQLGFIDSVGSKTLYIDYIYLVEVDAE